MAAVLADFIAVGKPDYITAASGVTYLDISTGIKYKQVAVPVGKAWKSIATGQVFTPSSGTGSVTAVTATAPVTSSGGATPVIGMPPASAGTDGYLTAADWIVFNAGAGGVPTTRLINTTPPLTGGGDLSADRTLSIPPATAIVSGYLTSADWVTFNGKQAALGYTPENVANKATTLAAPDNTKYPTTLAVSTAIAGLAPAGNYITELTGDVVAVGPGVVAATIQPGVVDNTKLAPVNDSTFKGRDNVGVPGDPMDLTATQATALLDEFTPGLKGLAPPSGGGTSNYLRADGSWNTPPGTFTLNTLSGAVQTLAVGTTGTDFAIVSIGTSHTFNLPDAGASARGVVTTGAQTMAGAKTWSGNAAFTSATTTSLTVGTTKLVVDVTNSRVGVGVAPTYNLHVTGATGPLAYFDGTGASTRVGINHATNTGFGLYVGGTLRYSHAAVNIYGGTNPEYLLYNDATSAAVLCVDGNTNNIRIGDSSTQPTAYIHFKAGASGAGTAPMKFTSGTNNATGETGAVEYNGTNLFFVRTGTTREAFLIGLAGGSAPTTAAWATPTTYYGTAITTALGIPATWINVVDSGGVARKIPAY